MLQEGMLIGIGNPLLDLSANVESELLEKYDLKPNGAIIAVDKHKPLYRELMDKYQVEFIAGGSVQNTLRVAQWLLEKPNATVFFGGVGDDDYAKILKDKAREAGVNVQYHYDPKEPTGTCAVLITGYHRSLCANLSAANNFTVDHLKKPENKKLIESAQYIYCSGYFLTVCVDSMLELAKHTHAHNKKFIMNLSAPFIAQYYNKQFMQAMPYIDLLFGNETEAETFANEQNFGTKDLVEIALKLCKLPKQNDNPRTVIITRGPHAVLVAREGKITEYPVERLPEEKIVDTNGAGDAFVGGFLAQYMQSQPLDVCVKCGIWCASHIIQRSGCTYEGKAKFER